MRTARHNPAVSLARQVALCLTIVMVTAFLASTGVLAQGCAMCQTVMPRGSEPMARGMFWSVLLLMCAPFAVGTSIGGWVFYCHRRVHRAQRTAAPVLPLHLAYVQKEGQP